MGESLHQIIGRYALFDEIASGGMATVHIGRLIGPVGFSRTVAIKRLHPHFAKDPEFVSMFVDEARLAARVRHPNVVPTLDVVRTEDELFLVMEYVQGESLSRLMHRARVEGRPLPVRLVVPVLVGVLHGLHAAHIAKGERGEALAIVHRDVSPQNVLVGTDGVPRVFDFGIAKARGRLQTTREGQIKGKLAYMAPEQLSGGDVGPNTDVYAACVVLWEALAGQRCFDADNEALLLAQVIRGVRRAPSEFNENVPADVDRIVMKGLSPNPADRFATAREMAVALENTSQRATATEIGEWVEEVATATLQKRADRIAEIESQSEIMTFGDEMISSSRPSQARLRMPSDPDWMDASEQPTSQMSSISVAGVPRKRTSGFSWQIGAAIVALLFVGASGAVAVFGGSSAAPAPSGDPIETAVEPAEGGSAAPTASAKTEATSEPSAMPTAEPSASTLKKPATVPHRRPVARPVAKPQPEPQPKKLNPCANPFYYENGIKKIKPQCR